MCVVIGSVEHPDYPLILLSNRDEFFCRPTQSSHYRPSKNAGKILSPLDLAREEHGTWIAISTSGKLASLVNYREENFKDATQQISRGILPLIFIESKSEGRSWPEKLYSSHLEDGDTKLDLNQIGGFSLLYGDLKLNSKTKRLQDLKILSNRGELEVISSSESMSNGNHKVDDTDKSSLTFGLSNSLFKEPWPKVERGRAMLKSLILKSQDEKIAEDVFVEQCFALLSTDTYPKDWINNPDFVEKFKKLRQSIFIPPLSSNSPEEGDIHYYGTRTQIVILLDKSGQVSYYERNLHDSDDILSKKDVKTSKFNFHINS